MKLQYLNKITDVATKLHLSRTQLEDVAWGLAVRTGWPPRKHEPEFFIGGMANDELRTLLWLLKTAEHAPNHCAGLFEWGIRWEVVFDEKGQELVCRFLRYHYRTRRDSAGDTYPDMQSLKDVYMNHHHVPTEWLKAAEEWARTALNMPEASMDATIARAWQGLEEV